MTMLKNTPRTVASWFNDRLDRLPPNVRRWLPTATALIAGLVIGGLLFRAADPHGGHEHLATMGEDGTVEYTCSMHPTVRQPGPGKCPICGMDLIPVATDGDDHGDLPRLTVSERAAALMAIQVWPAERRGVTSDVSLFGQIGYDETLVNDVILRSEGQVERLYVNYENAPVQRGQRIADIFSPAVLSASQELLQAQRASQRAGGAELLDAARTQLLLLGVSEAQVAQILESGQPARTYTVFAPAGGIVSELNGRQGEWLMSGARLMRIGGLGQVWAQFEAFEGDIGRLRVGRPLRFTVESMPGEVFLGTIAFIDPIVDGSRRTARVRVQVSNTGVRLKPGMLARGVATGAASTDSPVVIPSSAPLLTGNRAVVYVQLPGFDRPTFEARDVTLRNRNGAFWEVGEGLSEGELVVVNGAFKIDSELQIRGRSSMMSPAIATGGGAEIAAPSIDPVNLSAASGRLLEDVVRAYLDVTAALAHDNPADASRSAGALSRALDRAEMNDLASDAGREWNLLRRRMTGHAATMARSANVELLRRELLPLSLAMDSAVRTFRSNEVGELFLAVCPMVDGGEGFWLTRVEAVENPYHGASMFRCGEVRQKVTG
jgi:membrane fusion protein, copper/silver efflux system